MPVQRDYQGPAILSWGFRPFFLLGAIYAALAIPVWLAMFAHGLPIPTAFAPRDWHVHEMLFGFVAAILGGFLLTAVPNWTGRLRSPRMRASSFCSSARISNTSFNRFRYSSSKSNCAILRL